MKKEIEDILISNGSEYYVYAETAFSHEGDFEYLKCLVNEACEAQADGIKFQILLNADESYSENIIQNSTIRKWIFSENQWIDLIKYAKYKKGLDVIVLPIDMEALLFCEKNMDLFDAIEIHSINFNHVKMLQKINVMNKVTLLGIGGRTLADIEYILNKLEQIVKSKKILCMHGFQSFPTNIRDLKMQRIDLIKNLLGLGMGYADHTLYSDKKGFILSQFAYLNGARFFEKHLVLHKGEKRTDYEAAVEKEDFIELRKSLDELIEIQGYGCEFVMTNAEEKYRAREKQIVACTNIKENHTFSYQNLNYKVTEEKSDFGQKEFENIIGKKASCNIGQGKAILYEYVK